MLAHYLHAYYDDPEHRLLQWANAFAMQSADTGTRELLLSMPQFIRDQHTGKTIGVDAGRCAA